MAQIAAVVKEVLSDGSEVFNVVLAAGEQNVKIVIGAEDALSADDICTAINAGASWVQA